MPDHEISNSKEKSVKYGDLNTNIPISRCCSKTCIFNVVVVYHVTIVAIGHGLFKKFWPLVIGCVLRTAGSSII